MRNQGYFLEIADRIGRRIVEQALWQGERCTWQIMTPDRENGLRHVAVPQIATAAVYEGTSGIGVFLLELCRCTGSIALRRTAEGAVRYALAYADQMPPDGLGFFSGRVGVAYAAAKAGTVLDESAYLERAEHILRGLSGREIRDQGLDVIAGAAGAIPALLELRGILDSPLVTDIATRLGDHLIRVAKPERVGWSWGTTSGTAARNLTGFAHGAAGIGHALIELYLATGCGHYRYAAEQAFLYERQFFDPDEKNWPDFRNNELWEYMYGGRLAELRRMLANGRRPARYEPRFMRAWCHGAPGIGLSRLRAYEVLGEPSYETEIRASVESTATSLEGCQDNFSLCHGIAGNCELLLQASAILDDDALRRHVETLACYGAERYEAQGVPWPCGTPGCVSDPGLMLGEAGIGYFFLRLAVDAPSILLIRGAGATVAAPPDQSYAEMRERYIDAYLGTTRRIFAKLDGGIEWPGADGAPGETGVAEVASDVAVAYHAVEDHIEAQTNRLDRERLEDAFLVDAVRYRMVQAIEDFGDDLLWEIRRSSRQAIDWATVTVRLADDARLVRTRWDWEAWLEGEAHPDEAHPDPAKVPEPLGGVAYLLWRRQRRIEVRRLHPFPAAVLEAARVPATLDGIMAVLEASFEVPGERAALEARVCEQLAAALRTGAIECTSLPESSP